MTEQGEVADGEALSPAQNLRCFVIGPIGNKLAPQASEGRMIYEEALQVWEEIIRPACQACDVEPVRADGIARAGEITDQIFRRLRDDDVVIADLTGANANVMYELGLRHTRNLLTVQIGEFSRLPFDVKTIRTIMFSRSAYGLITARDELIEVLKEGLAGEYDHVGATRIWHEEPASLDMYRAETDTERTTQEETEEPPGFMDLVAEGEAQQETLTEATTAIGEAIERLGAIAEGATGEMEANDARGGGMRGRLAVVARFANELDAVAHDTEEDVSRFEDAMKAVASASFAIVERIEEDPSQLDEALEWGRVMRGLAHTARESMASLNEMVGSMVENAKVSRLLRNPTRRLRSMFGRFEQATSVLDELDRRLQALGIPMPPEDSEPAVDDEAQHRSSTS